MSRSASLTAVVMAAIALLGLAALELEAGRPHAAAASICKDLCGIVIF
ncbi:MAG TPA: hypothetical protein VNH64_05680 [Parvularculaceae bacterium]|nr:hypothetical protein [Parvularculaceae bacterium]